MEKNEVTTATVTENPNLPAVKTDNLPTTAPAPVETIEYSQESLNELIEAIHYAESVDLKQMEAVRVDATYLKMEKKDESITRMIAGYSWRNSEFGEGQVLSVNLYDIENKCFEYAMQTALVGKMMEGKMPKGQIVRITYLGKTKGKKYQYDDFKIEAMVPKKTV